MRRMHLSSAHLAAWQGGPIEDAILGADLAKGGAYLEELFASDIVVIGAPMYNFSIPSQLKAWIDRVVVAGKTFRYGANGAEGLLKNKKVFIASSRGNVYTPGSPAAALEHHESYLTGVLSFIGLTDVTIVRAEGLALVPMRRRPPCSRRARTSRRWRHERRIANRLSAQRASRASDTRHVGESQIRAHRRPTRGGWPAR